MALHEIYEQAYKSALEMIENRIPKLEILTFLTKTAEKAAGTGTASSILLLDKDGLLRNGSSPRLPADYLKAIDGLKPHPGVGTCAAAAATATMVITQDFRADDKWSELRHLPLSLGYNGAWSTPIISESGKVLGTFGTYFREKRVPSDGEINGVKLLAAVASLALLSCPNE